MFEKYDHVILIKNIEHFETKNVTRDNVGGYIVEVFKTYMGKRLIEIEFHDMVEYFLIGLILNPEMLHKTTETGPVYGTDEALNFKKLWGEMSQIVRANGGVHETVIWPENGNLTLKIVNFIMKEQLGFPIHGVKGGWHQIYSDQFSRFLKAYPTSKQPKKDMATITEAYDVLNNTLAISTASENFKKLPVHINELRPIGAWSKYTNIFPEKCISINGFNVCNRIDQINPVYHVALIVEANNKWPSEIDAFALMKKLFIAKLTKILFQDRKIISKVLVDGQLDILVKGFVFRCFLVIKKELVILKRMHNDQEFHEAGKKQKRKAQLPTHITEPLCDIAKPVRDHLLQQELIMAINIHIRCFSTQFGQVFTETCRLAKRWLASQHIELIDDCDERITESYLTTVDDNHHILSGWCFSEVAIELIVASLFIHPNCEYQRAPQSTLSGFIRFLRLMSEYDWDKNPLVLNINDGFSEERLEELSQPFLQSENRYSQLPMVVIRTPVNVHGDHWTNVGPNLPMLQIVKKLAKQAFICVKHLLLTEADLKPIFTVDTSRFGVLFHFKKPVLDLVVDRCIDVEKIEIKKLIDSKKVQEKNAEKKYQMWPKDYDDSPIDNTMKWIRSFVQNDAVCTVDKFGGRFIALEWLKKESDKEFIIKTICNKCRDFISKCEILE